MKTNYKALKPKNDNFVGEYIIYYGNFNYRGFSNEPVISAYKHADELAKTYNNVRLYFRANSDNPGEYLELPAVFM